MATREIKTRLSIDGEREYKQALSDISKSLSVLDSNLKLVDERYRDNADSVEALSERGEALEKTLEAQRKRVEELRKAHDNAAEQVGENDRRTQEWQIKLNNAERAVVKTERAIRENNEALEASAQKLRKVDDAQEDATGSLKKFSDGQGNAAGGVGKLRDILGSLTNKLGIDLPQGAGMGNEALSGLSGGMGKAAGAAAGLVAIIVALEKAMIDISLQSAEWADELATTATKTGVSERRLQEYAFAAEFVDVSLDTLTSTQTKLINSMDSARAGSEEAAGAFEQLGVSIENSDGTLRDAQEVYWEAIDALGEMKNTTEADALAMDIFGRSAQDLNPLIRAGRDGMEAYAYQAQQMGLILSGDLLQALTSLDDAYQLLTANLEGQKNLLAAEFAPSLTNVLDITTQLVTVIAEFASDSGLVDTLGVILEVVAAILEVLKPLLDLLAPIVQTLLDPISKALAIIGDALTLVIAAVDGLVSALLRLLQVEQQMDWGFVDKINNVFSPNGMTARAFGWNAGGSDYWRGGLTWVGENGPELVGLPTGSRIYNNADSMRIAGGGDTYNISINATNVREFNDIVRIAKSKRASMRAGIAR